ncbi:MAG: CARDB domain-containing protein, partial [Candidatus Woesearchaeota archaeon]
VDENFYAVYYGNPNATNATYPIFYRGTIFYDAYTTNLNNYSNPTGDWSIYLQQARAYACDPSDLTTLTDLIDLSSWYSATITFQYREEGTLEADDCLYYGIYSNGSWIVDEQNVFCDDVGATFLTYNINLNYSEMSPDFRLRYRCRSFSGAGEYLYIDNLNITGYRLQHPLVSSRVGNVEKFVYSISNDSIGSNGLWNWLFNTINQSYGLYSVIAFSNETGYLPAYNFTHFNIYQIVPPTVYLITPENNSYYKTTNITFNCSASDNTRLVNATLYGNWGGWHANETASLGGTSNYTIFTKTLQEGTYVWNCLVYNVNNYSSFAFQNNTFTIDLQEPIVNLISPEDNYSTNNSVVEFTYNVTDNALIKECYLIIDDDIIQTDTTITTNANQTFIESLTNGLHNWTVNCSDMAGNTYKALPRKINVSATPILWDRRWYETSTFNCNNETCYISLANSRDPTENQVYYSSVNSNQLVTALSAVSPYFGSNGLLITQNTQVSFSGEFLTNPANKGLVSWYLYYTTKDSDYLICNATNIALSPTTVASCNWTGSDLKLNSTNRFKLVITYNNTFSSAVSFTHTWDYLELSYFELSNMIVLGFLKANLLLPENNLTINQNQVFNLTCNVSCDFGTCRNVRVYAQYNDSETNWTNIGSSGNLVLNSGETNPHTIGDVNQTSINTTFAIKGNLVSTNNVRCFAVSDYSNTTTEKRTIYVGDSTPPQITISNPENNSWHNQAILEIKYVPFDNNGIVNCSLIVDGNLNQTNSTIANNEQNNFTISLYAEGMHNLSITCFDVSNNQGNSTTIYFYYDKTSPTVNILSPENEVEINKNLITFNFTAVDTLAYNLSCNLTIDNEVKQYNITAQNNTLTSITEIISLGNHYWNVTCYDLAGNYNTSQTWMFTILDTAPYVVLITPENNSWDNTGNITFYFNVSENNALENCSLILNNVINQTKNSTELINGGQNNFTITNLQNGVYNWSVNCTDDSGLIGSSELRVLIVDTLRPTVFLVTPQNNSNYTTENINFTFYVVDNLANKTNCNITLDDKIIEQNLQVYNNTNISIENNAEDGLHYWNITCTDYALNYNTSLTYIFNVSSRPNVTLVSPASNTWTNGNITFTFTVYDNDGIENCSLIINSAINQTKNSSQIVNGQENNFTVYDLPESVNNLWTIICYDTGAYNNYYQPSGRLFHVDRTPPNITLIYPGNEQTINETFVNFNFIASDNFAFIIRCNITIDNDVIESNISVQSGTSVNITVTNFEDGIHYWNVSCWDNVNNINYSETRWFNISVPPVINLISPGNNSWQNSENITFTYYVVDNTGVAECSLIINGQVNQTSTEIVNEDYNNFTINYMSEGIYNWSINCTDTFGVTGSSEKRILYVDKTGPAIYLNSPREDEIVSSNYVTFNWTAYDNLALEINCSLYVDGSLKEENIILENGSYANRTYIYPDGIYSWNVSCFDLAENYNWSETRNFTVEAPPNVTLDFPENNTWFKIENITFYYTPYDPIGIRYCEIYIDEVLKGNDSDIEKNVQNSFYITEIEEGIHNWTINCIDSDWNNYSPEPNIFYVDKTPPVIQIFSPTQNQEFNESKVLFNWTAYDNLALNITCNLTINNQLVQSNIEIYNNTHYNLTINDFKDNIYSWNLSCSDFASNDNTTETRIFNVSVKPEVFLISPENNTWLKNSEVIFYFNTSDNDGIKNCTLILNGIENETNNNITDNAQNNITSILLEGIYNWSIRCYDNGTFNNFGISQEQRLLYVDLTEPAIILYAPENNSTLLNNSAVFNFTTTDYLSTEMICNLTLDNQTRIIDAVVTNNTPYVETIYNLSYGMHYWNVTCKDYANRTNTSLTYAFRVPRPDLKISSEDIVFVYETQNPEEGKQVTINATIHNLGASNAENFTVQFFDGNPDFEGEQIGNNITMSLEANSYDYAIMNWTAKLGTHNIFVILDPPLETNGSIEEEDETNNIANKTILVESWHYFYGNLSGSLLLRNLNNSYVYVWNVSEANDSNIFAADYDSNINWSALKAISRDLNDNFVSNDFSEIDHALGMQNYTDSVNRTYTINNLPKATSSFAVFNKLIENVPVVESFNNSNFMTGILWDYSDGSNEYNGTQDLVFITRTNIGKQGSFDVCDYEFRVPSNLKSYKGTTDSVVFYIEIK